MLLVSSTPSSRAKSYVLSVHVWKWVKKRYVRNISLPIRHPHHHPPHILNTASIYVQIDDTEHHVAKSQSNYFWVSIDDLHYSSLIHAVWNERVIWMKNFIVCAKAVVYWRFVRYLLKELAKKQDSIA